MKSFTGFLSEAQKKKQKIVAVYPGRFQTPHKGHKFVYDFLKRKFGSVKIATSNKVELPKSPFNFDEKQKLLSFAGIPTSDIV